jgi:hypothetical protein
VAGIPARQPIGSFQDANHSTAPAAGKVDCNEFPVGRTFVCHRGIESHCKNVRQVGQVSFNLAVIAEVEVLGVREESKSALRAEATSCAAFWTIEELIELLDSK